MKKIIFILSLALLTSCATQTSFNDFYQANQEQSDFSIGLNSSLLSSFLPEEDFEEIKPLLKKAKNVKVLVFDENADQMNSKFSKFIKRSDFESIITVKDDGDNIKIYALQQDDKIKEIVIDVHTGDELVLLGLRTNLTEDDIAKIMQDNDISFN